MIGMWFTFGLDAKCLVESVKSFRRLFPDGIVCLSDDPLKPLPDEIIVKIAPNEYVLRNWNSSRNLNGWDAIRGILQFQVDMQKLYPDAVGALKIDSDTMIIDKEWIDVDRPISGFSAGQECLFLGMCRYLRKDVPERLLSFVATRWLRENYRVPEDCAISSYCALLYGMECNSINWGDGAKSFSYIHEYLNQRKCKVITFGNRSEIESKNDAQKRIIAGIAMEKYNDWIDSQNVT